MFKFCRSCDSQRLYVWEHCSICILASLKGDKAATALVETEVVKEQMELQLEAHPEVDSND